MSTRTIWGVLIATVVLLGVFYLYRQEQNRVCPASNPNCAIAIDAR